MNFKFKHQVTEKKKEENETFWVKRIKIWDGSDDSKRSLADVATVYWFVQSLNLFLNVTDSFWFGSEGGKK